VNLVEFMASQNWELLKAVNGWEVERDGDLLHLKLAARDDESYRVRLNCAGVPDEAPSVVFVDGAGNPNIAAAWPKGTARFFEIVKPPPSCFICMPLTAEGLQHHPEWRSDPAKIPWSGEKHTPLVIFNELQRMLNGPDYTGRGP